MPSPDHSERLYILACDHRASFRRALFGTEALSPCLAAKVRDAKSVVLEGLMWAVEQGVDRASAGLLMDTETSSDLVASAKRLSVTVAIPVERGGGGQVFDFDHGKAYRQHIERHDPDYAKALVHYNPDGNEQVNALQRRRLARLSRWTQRQSRRLLLELLVPATPTQLTAIADDLRRYDAELRPNLTIRAIEQLREAGVNPRVWKLEGMETTDDCRRVAARCQEGLNEGSISCIVLGRGADLAQVRRWLANAATVPAYRGFAVGRSIWMAPLLNYVAGRADRAAAVACIGGAYLDLVAGFEKEGKAGW
ncbi:2-deoxy-5-keto-D-gluconate 6-phosphate aldolase domain-containing protein [Streptomyces sp. NPDC001978]|uniref:2-deoxy-5-keto-D-gluconate 6-phosphate aldolase domain-containing protein n=1 Tax=Streptomyces sp. NPDC001978 TaxID=3364627 RepID=UPI00367ACFAA